jgi:hypothetical protein
VIDACFVSNHYTQSLNRSLSHALPRQTKLELSHLSTTYYYISFNSNLTNEDYQATFREHLTPQGYISFMWSPAIMSSEHRLGFKVWLDLVDLPPHVWSLHELDVVLASFGLILAHSPLNKVPSFERLHLVIATDNLTRIPHNIQLFLHRRISTVPIVSLSWTQEATPFESIKDSTSAEAVYENMAQDLRAKMEAGIRR